MPFDRYDVMVVVGVGYLAVAFYLAVGLAAMLAFVGACLVVVGFYGAGSQG